MLKHLAGLCLIAVAFSPAKAFGDIITIDFEGMPDMVSVTGQYASLGVEFEEALILTAGFSLNEFDFPPHSGTQVLGDDWGPVVATFSTPVSSAGAYFTYAVPLTLYGYDSASNLVATANSAFADNYGSTEYLSIASSTPISQLVMMGDQFGNSYTLDDFSFEPVPAPGALLLGAIGMMCVRCFRPERLGRRD